MQPPLAKVMKIIRKPTASTSETKVNFYRSLLTAIRYRQWTKNLIVFAAPLFAFKLNLPTILASLLTFVLFCGVSSSFYLINDIADVKADRQHPVKCKRPIASGIISVPLAATLASVLLGVALIGSWLLDPRARIAIVAYALLQVGYNFGLKRTAIVDIGAIATGFVIRAYAGAAATGIILSPWFLLCTGMLALFLGIEKRKAELRTVAAKGGTTRAVLKDYSLPLLTRMESIVTPTTVMSYALWSFGPQLQGASTRWMILTLPFVLYGIFRYQLLSDPKENLSETQQKSERPEEILLTDLPMAIAVLGWVATVFAILLVKHHGVIN
jgi:decaprenyl-phosphate phosphoribosyltransferase